MYYLVVDGSYSNEKYDGGTGGYLLTPEEQYIDCFHRNIGQNNIVYADVEKLAILEGLEFAKKHNIVELKVLSDDFFTQEKIERNLFNQIEITDPIIIKIIELAKEFKSIQFYYYRCKQAHHLSRIYLNKKNLQTIKNNFNSYTKIINRNPKKSPKLILDFHNPITNKSVINACSILDYGTFYISMLIDAGILSVSSGLNLESYSFDETELQDFKNKTTQRIGIIGLIQAIASNQEKLQN